MPELTHLPDDESSGEPPGVPEDDGRVAITGLAGRFPGAGDVDAFWQLLVEGREGIAELSEVDLLASGVDAGALADPGYVRAKGVLGGADLFDAGFFGFSPREAEVMDPQHRVLLECAWHALESAGVDPHAIDGRIGVFAGASLNSYLLFNLMANPRVLASTGSYQTLLGSDKDFLATRVSYKLGLTGPSLTVQPACSTSLTAVHLACQSLLNHECDVAIAGGGQRQLPAAHRLRPRGRRHPLARWALPLLRRRRRGHRGRQRRRAGRAAPSRRRPRRP